MKSPDTFDFLKFIKEIPLYFIMKFSQKLKKSVYEFHSLKEYYEAN